jgi:hypothetical protein
MSSSQISPTSQVLDPTSPRSYFVSLPPRLERLVANRWKLWAPWVRMELLRRPDYDATEAASELSRLRKRHSDQLVALVQAGVRMRLVRRHRLDDPGSPTSYTQSWWQLPSGGAGRPSSRGIKVQSRRTHQFSPQPTIRQSVGDVSF